MRPCSQRQDAHHFVQFPNFSELFRTCGFPNFSELLFFRTFPNFRLLLQMGLNTAIENSEQSSEKFRKVPKSTEFRKVPKSSEKHANGLGQ